LRPTPTLEYWYEGVPVRGVPAENGMRNAPSDPHDVFIGPVFASRAPLLTDENLRRLTAGTMHLPGIAFSGSRAPHSHRCHRAPGVPAHLHCISGP